MKIYECSYFSIFLYKVWYMYQISIPLMKVWWLYISFITFRLTKRRKMFWYVVESRMKRKNMCLLWSHQLFVFGSDPDPRQDLKERFFFLLIFIRTWTILALLTKRLSELYVGMHLFHWVWMMNVILTLIKELIYFYLN